MDGFVHIEAILYYIQTRGRDMFYLRKNTKNNIRMESSTIWQRYSDFR